MERTEYIYITEKVVKSLQHEGMLSKKGLAMSYADVESIGIHIWKITTEGGKKMKTKIVKCAGCGVDLSEAPSQQFRKRNKIWCALCCPKTELPQLDEIFR